MLCCFPARLEDYVHVDIEYFCVYRPNAATLVQVFPGKVLGLSWRGDTRRGGGICQRRVNVGTEEGPEMYNLNSLFITLRTQHTQASSCCDFIVYIDTNL